MEEKIKKWAKSVWAAVKSAPAVFGYGVAVGYLSNYLVDWVL